MKRVTIAAKIWGSSVASGLLLALMLGVTQWSTSQLGGDVDRLSTAPSAIRAAGVADMMHDAVNNDVLMATSSDDPAIVETSIASAEQHIDELNNQLTLAGDAGLASSVRDAAEALRGDSERYGELAKFAISAAGTPSESEAVASFQEQFELLEAGLPTISDAVEAETALILDDVASSKSTSRNVAIAIFAFGFLVVASVGLLLTRAIARPLRRAADVLDQVAHGDLSARLDHAGADEVGRMAESLNTALESIGGAMAEIGDHAGSLAGASEQLTAVSSQLASAADETSAQVGLVSAAADQVSENVATVASGTGEMNMSIQEISQNAHNAVSVANDAVRVAANTNDTVAKLGASSTEIGNVIKVISSIAEQTNLLALNATIEAARAGEAGKGFAVVAHEVKELANATSSATADISNRISTIQSDVNDAVTAIAEISEIIARVGETQSSIASAVEEQTATTTEISRNVSEAAYGSTEIAANIGSVANAANDASAGAGHTRDTASELSRMAGELQTLVGRFTC